MKANKMSKVVMTHGLAGCVTPTGPAAMGSSAEPLASRHATMARTKKTDGTVEEVNIISMHELGTNN